MGAPSGISAQRPRNAGPGDVHLQEANMADSMSGNRTVELSESEWEQMTNPEAVKRYSVQLHLNRYWSDRLDALADKSAEWGDDENPDRFVEKLFHEINVTP